VQVGLDPIEPLVEGNLMYFMHQLVVPMRHEFRHDRAENEQLGHGFGDGDSSRESDRHDIPITDRGCGHDTEVEGVAQSRQVRTNRRPGLAQAVLAEQRRDPVAKAA